MEAPVGGTFFHRSKRTQMHAMFRRNERIVADEMRSREYTKRKAAEKRNAKLVEEAAA